MFVGNLVGTGRGDGPDQDTAASMRHSGPDWAAMTMIDRILQCPPRCCASEDLLSCAVRLVKIDTGDIAMATFSAVGGVM